MNVNKNRYPTLDAALDVALAESEASRRARYVWLADGGYVIGYWQVVGEYWRVDVRALPNVVKFRGVS